MRIARCLRIPRERGQSLLEFILAATLLMWIISGVLDLGRMYLTYVAVQNAAAEGALYGSMNPPMAPGDQSDINIQNRVRNEAPDTGVTAPLIDWNTNKTTITVSCNKPPQRGDTIKVEVKYDYETFTPFFSRIWPTITLTGTATQIIVDSPYWW